MEEEEEEEEEGKWADGRRRGEEEKVLSHSRYYNYRTEGKSKALCAGGKSATWCDGAVCFFCVHSCLNVVESLSPPSA